MTQPATSHQRLAAYHGKRDFSSSPEPRGAARQRRPNRHKPLRFCVQKHLSRHLHFDFRLEHQGVLLSWAIPKGPSLDPADKRLAMRVEDHPLDYGHFEGVIPEGYGAGVVMLWDEGTWQCQMPDIAAALEQGELKFSLEGVKLKGSWVLVRTARDPRSWLLIKHRDEWSASLNIIQAAPDSVKSFGDMADILALEDPAQWQSRLAGHGGAAGQALRELIQQAAEKIAARNKPGRPRRSATKH